MNIEEFTSGLAEKGISLSPRQLEQFELYYDMLVEWNEKINLTSITEKKEVYLKHFYDSITAAFYVDFNQVNTICDVGAGAGFPSLPIKICFPHLHVTIVDSLNKRITFLEKLSEASFMSRSGSHWEKKKTYCFSLMKTAFLAISKTASTTIPFQTRLRICCKSFFSRHRLRKAALLTSYHH